MKTKHVKKVFDIFGKKTVNVARGILNAQGKNASGDLGASLGYFLNVKQGRVELRFLGAPYADLVDKGVKGSKSSAKAPRSPYSYKPSSKIAIKRKSLVFAIATSIKLFGQKPSNFFTDALNQGIKTMPRKFADAYARDAEEFILTVTKEM